MCQYCCSAGPCQANLTTSVNAASMTGQTALQNAVTVGHRDVVSLLIKHGADVNLASKVETHHDHTDIASSGINQQSTLSPLEIAFSQGDLEIMKLLLSNGAEDVGHKCLSSAILADNVDMAMLLLQQGNV